MRFINDLMHPNGRFFSVEEFTNRFMAKTNFLEYNGIVAAIKHNWREFLNSTFRVLQNPVQPHVLPFLNSFSSGCKPFYEQLVSFYSYEFQPRRKWRDDLGDVFNNLHCMVTY